MSDIAIRFDGLLLAAVIALSTLIFALVLLVALIMAACSERRRGRSIGLAKVALAQGGISLVCLLAVIVYMDVRTIPLSSVDWIDWMVVPWAVLFIFGVVRLIRFRGVPGGIS